MTAQAGDLDVSGYISLGDSGNDNPRKGTIRWSGSDFEGWNGVNWISLTGDREVGEVTDIDGNTYKTIRIGDRHWMVENLKTTRLNDGTIISYISSPFIWETTTGQGLCAYDNLETSIDDFGYLYNWYAVERNELCPDGWSVPSMEQWGDLLNELTIDQGIKMKMKGFQFWNPTGLAGTNESGFSAKGGGYRNNHGDYLNKELTAIWWALDPESEELGKSYSIFSASKGVILNHLEKEYGISVRCIKR